MAIARPNYSYTGSHELVLENHTVGQVYVLYLKSSGTLTLNGDYFADAVIIGGGGGGKRGYTGGVDIPTGGNHGGRGGEGGGAGQRIQMPKMLLAKNLYVSVGAGGASDTNGQDTIFQTGIAKGGITGTGAIGGYGFVQCGYNGKPGLNGAIATFIFNQGYKKCCATGAGGGGGGGSFWHIPINSWDNSFTCGGYGDVGGISDGGGNGGRDGDYSGFTSVVSTNGTAANVIGSGGGGGGGGVSGGNGQPGGNGAPGVVAIRFLNSPPTNPQSITTTGNQAGQPAVSSVTPSTDADNDPIQYVWEQRTDTGAYVQMGITDLPSITYNVPESGTTFTRRCKAVDNQGGESVYVTGADMAINYNRAPIISGADAALGTFDAAPPTWAGTVTDPDGDTITVLTKLNGAQIATHNGANVAISVDLSRVWRKTPNGNHTITITATDTKGASAVRTLTFVKRESMFEFYRGQSSTTRPNKVQISVSPPKSEWGDASVELWAANNANDPDDSIAWVQVPLQNLGDARNAAMAVDLINTTKIDQNWCFALHMKATEGASAKAVSLQTIQLNISAELELPNG